MTAAAAPARSSVDGPAQVWLAHRASALLHLVVMACTGGLRSVMIATLWMEMGALRSAKLNLVFFVCILLLTLIVFVVETRLMFAILFVEME